MRLWSLDPALLDRAALVACWREALLAQKVLQGRTKGYRNHPQLERFKATSDPASHIAAFLCCLQREATARGYRFNRELIAADPAPAGSLTVTTGQLELELAHLRQKVTVREPQWLPRLTGAAPHPLFRVVDGPVASWERRPLTPEPGP